MLVNVVFTAALNEAISMYVCKCLRGNIIETNMTLKKFHVFELLQTSTNKPWSMYSA